MKFTLDNYFSAHSNLILSLNKNAIENAINLIRKKIERGNKIIVCGNGGSASTASHFITDWTKMFNIATGRMIKGISLCDNSGLITAYANDFDYSQIFSGQLNCILEKDDLVIGISGSGNSINVINALNYANQNQADTLAIVGYDGGEMKKIAKHAIWVDCHDMQLCEDMHFMIGHLVMKSICNYDISL